MTNTYPVLPLSVKLPFTSVTTPTLVPLIFTVAPIIGCLSSLPMTLPVIFVWAVAAIEERMHNISMQILFHLNSKLLNMRSRFNFGLIIVWFNKLIIRGNLMPGTTTINILLQAGRFDVYTSEY